MTANPDCRESLNQFIHVKTIKNRRKNSALPYSGFYREPSAEYLALADATLQIENTTNRFMKISGTFLFRSFKNNPACTRRSNALDASRKEQ